MTVYYWDEIITMPACSSNSPLISVIVPVYNVDKYLGACIASLQAQTLANIEILLVDDGSTDGSAELCDELGAQDPRIRVIHRENGGLSAARNTGLKHARAELVSFVDADDVVHPMFLSRLYEELVSSDSDVSMCTFARFANEVKTLESCAFGASNTRAKVMEPREALMAIYENEAERIELVAWNKLYRKGLFLNNQIEYPEGRLFEDVFTTAKVICNARTVCLLKDCLYYYRARCGSIMSSHPRNHQWYFDRIAANYSAYCSLRNEGDRLSSLACKQLLRTCIDVWWECGMSPYKKQLRNEIQSVYRSAWKESSHLGIAKGAKYLAYDLFEYCPLIVAVIFRLQMSRSANAAEGRL